MASGVDFGKQVGPLPLGAWVVVVAGGLGIAVYTRRQGTTAVAEPTVVDNTSGDAGVGTGAVGGWIPTTPNPTGSTPVAVPTTNDEWAVMVENGLIGRNYPPPTVDSMVRKYIAGASSTMSPAEYGLLAIALATYGGPPQTLPPDGTPSSPVPPTGSTGSTPPTPTASDYLGAGVHRIGVVGRSYTMRSIATRATRDRGNATVVETNLRRIVAVNPHLRGRSTVTGGTIVVIPPGLK